MDMENKEQPSKDFKDKDGVKWTLVDGEWERKDDSGRVE